MKPGEVIYYQEPVFINPCMGSSAMCYEPIPKVPDIEIRIPDTPIDKAVQAVRDAQDSVGKIGNL